MSTDLIYELANKLDKDTWKTVCAEIQKQKPKQKRKYTKRKRKTKAFLMCSFPHFPMDLGKGFTTPGRTRAGHRENSPNC